MLDAGCGGGLLSIGFSKEYIFRRGINVTIHAFDISESMLNLTDKIMNSKGVRKYTTLYKADGQDLSNVEFYKENKILTQSSFHDNSFDLVMTSGMLEHVINPEKSIYELTRVLKPGKQLVLSFVNDNLLGKSVGKLWNFKVLSKDYLFEKFSEIKDFKKVGVDSYNFSMKCLKSIYIGVKA